MQTALRKEKEEGQQGISFKRFTKERKHYP
jgi:hypothetical protein